MFRISDIFNRIEANLKKSQDVERKIMKLNPWKLYNVEISPITLEIREGIYKCCKYVYIYKMD